jgi:hypothetical protein
LIHGGIITFTDIKKGKVLTANEGQIDLAIGNSSVFAITENTEEANQKNLTFEMKSGTGSDLDKLEIRLSGSSGPGTVYGDPEVLDEDNDKVDVYMTTWGSRLEIDNDDDNDFMLWHPAEQLYVEVFVAETGATTSVAEGAGEGCQVSETINRFRQL